MRHWLVQQYWYYGNSAIFGELKTTTKADMLASRDKNWNLSKNNKDRANKNQIRKRKSKTRRSSRSKSKKKGAVMTDPVLFLESSLAKTGPNKKPWARSRGCKARAFKPQLLVLAHCFEKRVCTWVRIHRLLGMLELAANVLKVSSFVTLAPGTFITLLSRKRQQCTAFVEQGPAPRKETKRKLSACFRG